MARAYKWSDDMWVIPLLSGRAMAAYANMDQEMEKDYEEVKQAILTLMKRPIVRGFVQ